MPRLDLIDMKLNRVLGPMVKDLKNNQKVFDRVGGAVFTNLGEEIKLQEARQTNLIWAKTATDNDIKKRISELSVLLAPEELACKYGSVRGLSAEKVEIIAKIEDLEIALGMHPAIGGVE
jgi:hypothetical protein